MDSKPGSVVYMESLLANHILPRFGATAVTDINEMRVQEFIADLKRTVFERRRPDGSVLKTYHLARKTILNIIGVLKLVLGKKIWMTWEINVGRVAKPDQRYFTQDELRRIIEHSPARYRTLFALLAGTGMRIGEAAGLHIEDVDLNQLVIHIRRAVWRGKEQTPSFGARQEWTTSALER